MFEKSLLLISLICTCLTACQSGAHVPPLEQRMHSWKGASFSDLVQAWGLPFRQSFETETGYAEWKNAQTKRGPSISIGLGGFGGHVSGRIGTTIHGDTNQQRCVIQVQFNADKKAISLTSNGIPELCESLVPTRH